MHPSVRTISQRLSLRSPQRESLEILDTVFSSTGLPKESPSLAKALDVIREHYPTVEDFERGFPSLCFSLATGVGKTRLMGAFITYLHIAHGIRNFFVLAPNLTIYEKLITDFTPNTPKYVFKGIAEFATDTPWLITGDNYEEYRGQGDLYGRVEINIFNIAKLNRETKEITKDTKEITAGAPRIRRLRETLGESYFDYLKSLPDLVLLMDESHRYRADAGARALNELDPLIGLELTATPFLDRATGPVWFKNVIYDYPLASAIEDGFVKDPAVATQVDFNAKDFSDDELERIKLEDGIRLHEETKIELDTYARQTGRKRVKPFMLVIARDTTHAAALKALIESEPFFQGAYAGKVLQVDSSTKKKEEDTVERLLQVESPDEPTEIVIHVNMLKEGWDVNNLFTIVPLRAANARTLIEQTVGRGLRLPYGHRTGVEAVDRLTIVAHDKFQEIIEEANKPDSPVRIKTRIIEKPREYKKPVQVISKPGLEAKLFGEAEGTSTKSGTPKTSEPIFKTNSEKRAGQKALELLRKQEHLPSVNYLDKPEVTKDLAKKLEESLTPMQLELEGVKEKVDYTKILKQAAKALQENTIEIPRITVIPKGDTSTGFHPFEVDTSGLDFQPVERDLLLQYLNDNRQSTVASDTQMQLIERRPEDYIVRQLIDFDDVSYDEQADFLYDLAGQVVEHFKKKLSDDDLLNVLRYHERAIAKNIHSQMQPHFWEKSAGSETKVLKGWMALKDCPFNAEEGSEALDFRVSPAQKSNIRRYVYTGFSKCLYPFQKFDSDAERRFAEILEGSHGAEKWFKPASGQFSVYYRIGSQSERSYEPDFVVETSECKYLVEVKREDQTNNEEVLAKAEAGAAFCEQATAHAATVGATPWAYLLIPDTVIQSNMSLVGLAEKYSHEASNLDGGK
ncbi:DEAD/DEAH box helicase family protein [Verrucomicrobiales bacterium BCK34]|nr:DEAD/DEAH box helicase family protein [Verrucomicrobiales bacterium BCK34]